MNERTITPLNDGDNPPAFPNTGNSTWNLRPEEGMPLRDYFAGQFLAGAATDNSALDIFCAADPFDIDLVLREHWSQVANAAYIAADAMLRARKGNGQ